MGLLPCPLTCHTIKESQSLSQSQSNYHLQSSDSSTSTSSSLSSQPSLPSVSSLASPFPPPTTTPHHCLATLKGHSSSISSLAVAGKFLFTGSSDSETRAWTRNPFDHNNVVATGGNGAAVKSLVVLDDKLLISAHQDHKIRVWKIDLINNSGTADKNKRSSYECIATLPTLNDRFMRSFSAKNYVEVRRHKKSTWVHHVDTVSALAISRDGSLLYSASWDRTFKIWRTSDFKCLESVNGVHDDAVNAIVVSNDGFVYTGSADKKIKVWKKQVGEKKHSLVGILEKHKSAVNALALCTDGSSSSVLFSGACDRSILVWERDNNGNVTGHMVLTGALRGHTKAILCLAVVSNLVCSGSADNTVRIWRRASDEQKSSYSCMAVLEGHRRPVKCLTAVVDSDDNNSNANSDSGTSFLVYSGSLDCDIKIWQIRVPYL
ncbi:hypothetical protein Dsin_010258 [Dipteronia sinensis]|uniref:Uncharacterized protein n=1 Tax=Dipteronia sinensis TaxID=43782 RepID=A0AAE0ASH0_9ROSI|nr:hypothetical protein Dsin_010258 [Dipteronia sinensis]